MRTINTYINEKLRLSVKPQYTCQPKDKDELRNIIIQRINDEGPTCDLNDIDVSKITDMSLLFDAVQYKIFKGFNGDVSMWDVSNVENMFSMFYDCEKFNCDISQWNVSNVKYTNSMFHECEKFNCDLSKWDVSNVQHMACMFFGCKNFRQDLNLWNVSDGARKNFMFFACPTNPTWYDKKTAEKRR